MQLSNKLLMLLLMAASHLPATGQNTTAEEWFQSGTRKFDSGDFRGAVPDFTEAIRLNPQYADAFLYRGIAKEKLTDYEGAIADCNEVIRINPQYASAYNNRGYAKLLMRDYPSAIIDFSEALRIDEALMDEYVYSNRGYAKFMLQDYTGAIADYTEAIRIEPQNSGAYLSRAKAHLALGHRNEGCQDISQARLLGIFTGTWDLVREHCLDTASRWSLQSQLKVIIEGTDAEEGTSGYWKLIAGQPNILRLSLDTTVLPCFNPRVTARGGYAELSPTNKFMVRVTPLGGPFELIISNEVEGIWYEMDRVRFRVIVDQPTSQLLDSARVKEERQEYTSAIAHYTEAIRISPSLSYAYIKRGGAKLNIQDYQGAIADYTEAIRLEPWSANAYIKRGLAKGKLLDYQSAIADYSEAIRIEPQNDVAHNNRGYDKLMLRDYQGAIADCSEAIRLNPENDFAYNNRGEARAGLGDYAGAVVDFNEALRLAPNHTEALCNRGKARIQIGQRDEGCQDFAKAKEMGNPQAEDLIRQNCQ